PLNRTVNALVGLDSWGLGGGDHRRVGRTRSRAAGTAAGGSRQVLGIGNKVMIFQPYFAKQEAILGLAGGGESPRLRRHFRPGACRGRICVRCCPRITVPKRTRNS